MLRKLNQLFALSLLVVSGAVLSSCDSEEDNGGVILQPTALVTAFPDWNGNLRLQLDDSTLLIPKNLPKSPFGDKEVRALVNYTVVNPNLFTAPAGSHVSSAEEVEIHWIDSIRTKLPIKVTPLEMEGLADDPVEIVRDWVTVAEDGYLTLRLRTRWGGGVDHHIVNLVYDEQSASPLTFRLSHDACGDKGGNPGDALIAFNLNDVIGGMEKPVKITLVWTSYSGEKSAQFSLNCRRELPMN